MVCFHSSFGLSQLVMQSFDESLQSNVFPSSILDANQGFVNNCHEPMAVN